MVAISWTHVIGSRLVVRIARLDPASSVTALFARTKKGPHLQAFFSSGGTIWTH
jgi:hypothetical protein